MTFPYIKVAAKVASFSCEVVKPSPFNLMMAFFTSDFLGMYFLCQGISSIEQVARLSDMGEACLNGISFWNDHETMMEDTAQRKAVVFIWPMMNGGVSLAIPSISYFSCRAFNSGQRNLANVMGAEALPTDMFRDSNTVISFSSFKNLTIDKPRLR